MKGKLFVIGKHHNALIFILSVLSIMKYFLTLSRWHESCERPTSGYDIGSLLHVSTHSNKSYMYKTCIKSGQLKIPIWTGWVCLLRHSLSGGLWKLMADELG